MKFSSIEKVVGDIFDKAKDLFLTRIQSHLDKKFQMSAKDPSAVQQMLDGLGMHIQTELEAVVFIDLLAQLDNFIARIGSAESELPKKLSALSFGTILQPSELSEGCDSPVGSAFFDLEDKFGVPLETPGFGDPRADDSKEEYEHTNFETEYNYSPGRRLTTREDWDQGDVQLEGIPLSKPKQKAVKEWHNLKPGVQIQVVKMRQDEPKNLFHQMVYFLYKLTPTTHEGPVLLHEEDSTESCLESSVGYRFLSTNLISLFHSKFLEKHFSCENSNPIRTCSPTSENEPFWWEKILPTSIEDIQGYRKFIEMLANILEANVGELSTNRQNESVRTVFEEYESLTQNHVERTGVWTHSDFPWLAACVDGLVVDDNVKERGILKIYRHSNEPGSQWSDVLIKSEPDSARSLSLSRFHPVYLEIQLCLLLLDSEWSDVAIYTLDAPQPPPIHVERIRRDPDLQTHLIRFLSKLYIRMLLPSFAAKSMQLSQPTIYVLGQEAFDEEYRFIMQR